MEHFELTALDPLAPYRPFCSGSYVKDILLPDGQKRRLLIYIPRDVQTSVAGIFLLPPSGVSAEDFLAQSSWKDIADSEETKERLVLFVLESGPSGWNIEEPYGTENGDVAYINAAFPVAALRNTVCVHEAKYYMVGYREGGTLAQMAAMFDPAYYAGMVSVDALPVAPAFMEAVGQDHAHSLMGFEDPNHTRGIRKQDIPLPVWLIGPEWPDQSAECTYWRKACGCGDRWSLFDRNTHTYVRESETAYPIDQDRRAYRVWSSRIPNASEAFGQKLNRQIWKDFLYRVRRWMSEPGGSLRLTRDPVRDLGCEYHYELVDGWMREWYVYVPQAVREAPEKEVPLVFACHGYSCSGEIYMGNSGWNHVADKYGFIVVFPTAIYGHITGGGHKEGGASPDNVPLPTWNTTGATEGRPYENTFFVHMLNSVCGKWHIDRSRVYVTGHSNGSMMTSWLGLSRPELFAAIAPCSGILHMAGLEKALTTPEVEGRKQVELPVWMFGGMEEPWLLDGKPEVGNRTCESIYVWMDMNGMGNDKPTDFSCPQIHAERWYDWFYEKHGMPMVRFTGVEYFPHATNIEMSFRIWEEFFSRFRRDADGTLHWN